MIYGGLSWEPIWRPVRFPGEAQYPCRREREEKLTMPINAELKSRIVRACLTQTRCAEILGVSPAAITLWIKGDNLPEYEMAKKLCKLLNCELEDIFPKAKWKDLRREPRRKSTDGGFLP